jgi:BirA family transcriptional regulator, biotin operon repressor / biotin---[acetyl-CoA-carboxylase] ligase
MTRHRLVQFAELDSTNRYARARLANLQHGDVIQAGRQTAGRGRLDRSWISHLPGNLCLSLVIKPAAVSVPRLPLANLSQLLALATARVLADFNAPATLKWPNDILVDGRKVAGILAETVTRGGDFLGLVLGIGVNLNLDSAALEALPTPATSLSVRLNRPVAVEDFRDALLKDFFAHYEAFLRAGFGLIREEYLRHCQFLGQPIEVRSATGVRRGVALDINQDGALMLRDAAGQTHAITVGEMFTGEDVTQS